MPAKQSQPPAPKPGGEVPPATPPSRPAGSQPYVRWQANMVVVLTALAPAGLAALYFYGWRAVAVLAVTNASAFATELYFTRQRKEPVTSAVFVTGSLLALSLPPATPFWMCALGAAVGVAFGKELFGGMGRNVFNPALVGRAFLYVCFPNPLSAGWVEPLAGRLGGLAAWVSTDAVTSATAAYFAQRGLLYTWRDGKMVNSYHLHIKEWIDAIRGDAETSCGIERGFEEAITCHMATRAYREERKVRWDPVARRIV